MKNVYKIILTMILAISICGCGSQKEEIELTLDNYSSYLTFSGQVYGDGSKYVSKGKFHEYVYDNILVSFTVTGASSNYKYNNVKVSAIITGTHGEYNGNSYLPGGKEFSAIVNVECNVGGGGSTTIIAVENSSNISYYNIEPGSYMITGISGTVTEVK